MHGHATLALRTETFFSLFFFFFFCLLILLRLLHLQELVVSFSHMLIPSYGDMESRMGLLWSRTCYVGWALTSSLYHTDLPPINPATLRSLSRKKGYGRKRWTVVQMQIVPGVGLVVPEAGTSHAQGSRQSEATRPSPIQPLPPRERGK
ncbi:hypothetical protein B0I35DRAFT_238137 [Stachybotrys elegans]|uniref:Uncharacterized protein n=1 Tax=Stachybotrys elegans TaxID=80388 RepID=A0A8K0SR65_9HYPO|nr:hypothetical protein B0I35DRAFT_238137 [Stachybotrys elegans]